MRSAFFRLCALALVFLVGACARNDGATLYPLSGKIEALDIFDRELTIAHEEIPGYMPGMTMPFKLASPELAKTLKPEQQVRITFQQQGKDFVIIAVERIKP